MKFNVLLYNFSTHKVEHYNVIPYFIDQWYHNKFDKSLVKSKEDLRSWIRNVSQYQFWGRCEYESLLAAWPFGTKKMTEDIKKLIDSGADINDYHHNIDLMNIITQDMKKIDIHEQIMMNIDIITDLLYKKLIEKEDFCIGDKVKLKDGDGRIHIIESFEEDTFKNSIYIRVNFTDKSAIGCIFKDNYNTNNYYTDMIKIE